MFLLCSHFTYPLLECVRIFFLFPFASYGQHTVDNRKKKYAFSGPIQIQQEIAKVDHKMRNKTDTIKPGVTRCNVCPLFQYKSTQFLPSFFVFSTAKSSKTRIYPLQRRDTGILNQYHKFPLNLHRFTNTIILRSLLCIFYIFIFPWCGLIVKTEMAKKLCINENNKQPTTN